MLQRAASNAYSWWWASHIRTKQSKWLEQSLQDMGEKVEAVLKLIEEDGDSFIKRAEMYYKKRPEFINFVEESYRAYRSLAERYDLLSKELQNANNTLASAFPDQFQYQIDDDDDEEDGLNKIPRKLPEKPPNPNLNIPKAPPKFPAKTIKAYMALTAKPKKSANKSTPKQAANAQKSGLTKAEAIQEVDKLQKQILTLQTEKEFAKNSYESGYTKYWQIDEEIAGIQEKISKLQDEFEISQVIEDDEARTLMVETALKSCQETLAQLQEKQEKAAAEAKAERQRIKAVREKLVSLKGELLSTDQCNLAETSEGGNLFKAGDNWASFVDESDGSKESEGLEMLRDKIKEHFDVGSTASLTVSQMAEKVDELVNKVIDLETAVSSQTALIHRLRSETDDLQSQIKSLEDDKANLIDGKSTLHDKLREMENKLKELQDLNHSFENQNFSLETHFTEARSNIDTISEKLHDIRPDEEFEVASQLQESAGVAAMDVKKDVVQDIKGSDIVLPQDRDRDEKPVQFELTPSAPSRPDDIQLDEQPITKQHKPSTLDDAQLQEHPKEHQPEDVAQPQHPKEQQPSTLDVAQTKDHSEEHQRSTFEAAQPQEHPKEYTPSTLDVAQRQESLRENKRSSVDVAQPEEHPKEHQPSTFDAAQPQEHPNKYNLSILDAAQQQESPREHKQSTLDVAQREAHQKEHQLSTFDAAQPQEQPNKYNLSTLNAAQQQESPRGHKQSSLDVAQPEVHQKEHQPSTFDAAQPQEYPNEYKPITLDVAQPQEYPNEYKPITLNVAQQEEPPREPKPSTVGVTQPQEQPMEHNPSTVDADQPQEYPHKKDVELVNANETQQPEPVTLSTCYQGAQQRETERMVTDELNVPSSAKPQEQAGKEEDEPNWQQLFMSGMEGKEKVLLAEYTSTLRNYKTAKKKLGEMEKKTQADFSEITAQLQELKSSIEKKDDEIRSLQQKLYVLQKMLDEPRSPEELKDVKPPARTEGPSVPLADNEDIQLIAKEEEISPVELKLRADIDEILEENLDFWIRFSASFSQVQKFQTEVEDLHAEIARLEKAHKKKEGSGEGSSNKKINSLIKSDIKPLYKHLREIQTELTLWLEQSEKLRDELQSRFSQLCDIQEDIKQALNAGAEDEEMKFTSYQAAKFQGEVANMQQENNKVADELQAGMDHVTGLQLEVERTLIRLSEELGLSMKSHSESQTTSRSAKVPLRSFIFGAKPQKKKQSIFSFIHPMKHRRFQHLKSEKAP